MPDQAEIVLDGALRASEAASIGLHIPLIRAMRAFCQVHAGRLAEGLPVLEELAGRSEANERPAWVPFALAWLAEANLIAGRRDIARQLAERALDRFRQHRERGNEAWALRLHGEIAAAAEPPEVEQVESYYRQALALAEELGMRPLMAHCHLGLGTLYQKIGRQEPALTELTTAAELYRAMEMTFWLERAKLELLKVGD